MANPCEEFLGFTKDQLLKVASSYETEITSSDRQLKESIKGALKAILIEKGVLPGKMEEETPEEQSPVTTSITVTPSLN